MDFELSEDQKAKKEEFARFCIQEIEPHSGLIEEGGTKAQRRLKTHYRRLGEVGYLGLSFPEHLGGQGEELVVQAACDEILAKACRSTFLSAYTSAVHCGKLIETFGTEEQKRGFLRPVISGKKIASIARTETSAGSDVGGITTGAQKDGGQYVLHGQKDFCVNGPCADLFLVVTHQGPEKNMSVFIVPKDLPGVETCETLATLGYRGTPVARVLFNNCVLPAGALLGEEGKGEEVVQESFAWDTMGMISASIAIIEKALETSFRYSQTRIAFGKPIGSYQEVSFKLAEMRAMLDTARLLSQKGVWLKSTGDAEARTLLSCAKVYASEAASRSSSYAVQVHGVQGLLKDSSAGCLYRDAKHGEIGGGTSEIHRLSIAQSVLAAIE